MEKVSEIKVGYLQIYIYSPMDYPMLKDTTKRSSRGPTLVLWPFHL